MKDQREFLEMMVALKEQHGIRSQDAFKYLKTRSAYSKMAVQNGMLSDMENTIPFAKLLQPHKVSLATCIHHVFESVRNGLNSIFSNAYDIEEKMNQDGVVRQHRVRTFAWSGPDDPGMYDADSAIINLVQPEVHPVMLDYKRLAGLTVAGLRHLLEQEPDDLENILIKVSKGIVASIVQRKQPYFTDEKGTYRFNDLVTDKLLETAKKAKTITPATLEDDALQNSATLLLDELENPLILGPHRYIEADRVHLHNYAEKYWRAKREHTLRSSETERRIALDYLFTHGNTSPVRTIKESLGEEIRGMKGLIDQPIEGLELPDAASKEQEVQRYIHAALFRHEDWLEAHK